LKVPQASTATYASSPRLIAVIAGKAAQTSRESGEDQLLAARRLDRMSRSRVIESIDRAAVDDRHAGQRLDQLGNVGPHMLSRAVVVTTTGSFSALAALARPTTLCFKLGWDRSRTPVMRPSWWSTRMRASVIGRQRLIRAIAINMTPSFARLQPQT